MEIWKEWKPGIMVSNMGNIKGRKLLNDNRGYKTISYKNKKYRFHRIIAELFIPNPENKPQIDHINTIRDDNRVDNLRWCTPKENSNNELTIQHLKEGVIKSCKTWKKFICIENNKIYRSSRDAAKDLKCSDGAIRMVLKGINKSAGGFHFKYFEKEDSRHEK